MHRLGSSVENVKHSNGNRWLAGNAKKEFGGALCENGCGKKVVISYWETKRRKNVGDRLNSMHSAETEY